MSSKDMKNMLYRTAEAKNLDEYNKNEESYE
jgi:hypothetical protein